MNRLASVETAAPFAAAPAGLHTALAVRRWDPRLYQIATLAGLLGYGLGWLDLEIQPQTALAILASALATQLACARLAGRGRFDPRSALISGLSLRTGLSLLTGLSLTVQTVPDTPWRYVIR